MKLAYEQHGRQKLLLNLIVIAFSLYGIINQDYVAHSVSPLEKFFIDSFAPAQEQVSGVKRSVAEVFNHYFKNIDASKENVELQGQIGELKSRLFQYEGVIQENIRLRSLLKFSEEFRFQKIVARVVATDASSDYRVVRIYKGIRDGVKIESAVLTSEGVVGYVYRLTNSYADVLTIVDPNSRIDAQVRRIRVHGIVEGQDLKRCIMKYVSRTEPVILGDKIVTSGLGNIYPKGIQVGAVSKIERASYGITQQIEIRPSVNFEKLEEVFVLVSKDKDQVTEEWRLLDMLEMEEGGK